MGLKVRLSELRLTAVDEGLGLSCYCLMFKWVRQSGWGKGASIGNLEYGWSLRSQVQTGVGEWALSMTVDVWASTAKGFRLGFKVCIVRLKICGSFPKSGDPNLESGWGWEFGIRLPLLGLLALGSGFRGSRIWLSE